MGIERIVVMKSITVFFIFIFTSINLHSKLDSLFDANNSFDDSTRIKNYAEFYFQNVDIKDYQIVIDTLLEINERSFDQNVKGDANYYVSGIYYTQQIPLKSLEFASKSLYHYNINSQDDKVLKVLSKIGMLYIKLGNNTKSLEIMKKTSTIANKLKDTLLLMDSYLDQANVYSNLEFIEKSELMVKKYLEMAEKINSNEYKYFAHYDLAELEYKKSNYEKAFLHLKKAESYFGKSSFSKRINDENLLILLTLKFEITLLIDQSEAKKILDELSIAYKSNNEFFLTNNYFLAKYHFTIGNYQKAYNYIKKIPIEPLYYVENNDILIFASDLCRKMGKLEESIDFLNMADDLERKRQSVQNETILQTQEIEEIVNRYVEKIKFQSAKNSSSKNQNLYYLFFVLITVLIISVYFNLKGYFKKNNEESV